MGTAGEDGHEIFRWRVMLRKGKLRLPQNAHRNKKKRAGREGGSLVTQDKHKSPDGTKLHQPVVMGTVRGSFHTNSMDPSLP